METWPSLDARSGMSLVQARPVPWDTQIFGFRVASIDNLALVDEASSHEVLNALDSWTHSNRVVLTTCRLPSANLGESMKLEGRGFHFIETVLHPFIEIDAQLRADATGISIAHAAPADVDRLADFATRSFGFERYHADPRIDSGAANARYGHWIVDAWERASATLLKAVDNTTGDICGFFLTSTTTPHVHWLLTAIDPVRRGEGLGKRVWSAMLDYHLERQIETVTTTISAQNVPVMNLYASLGFRYLPPEMTFHRLALP